MQGKTTFLTFYLQIFILTIAWFVGSVLTLGVGTGAFTTGLYKTIFRALRENGEAITFKGFLKDVKENILIPTLLTLLFASVLIALYLLVTRVELGGLEYLVYFIMFEVVLLTLYAFPVLATFKFDSVPHALKTIGLMANFHVLTTIQVFAALIVFILSLVFVSVYVWPITLALYYFVSSLSFHKTFSVYIKRIQEADRIDEENDEKKD